MAHVMDELEKREKMIVKLREENESLKVHTYISSIYSSSSTLTYVIYIYLRTPSSSLVETSL